MKVSFKVNSTPARTFLVWNLFFRNETATEIHMNGPAAVPAIPYSGLTAKVDSDGNLFFTNTLYTRDSDTGNRNTEKVSTILTRFPAREPYAREEFTGN